MVGMGWEWVRDVSLKHEENVNVFHKILPKCNEDVKHHMIYALGLSY